jgi:hypothetical protein
MVWNLVTLKTACQANFAADSRRTFKKFLAALECLRDGRKKRKTEIISSPTTAMKKIFVVAAAIEIRATITAKDRRFNFFAGKLLHE